jgi:hypothetical protein
LRRADRRDPVTPSSQLAAQAFWRSGLVGRSVA